MQTFRYTAVNADGHALSGSLAAEDGRMAARELRKRGLVATDIRSAAPAGKTWDAGPSWRHRRATLRFTEEVATLLQAEVPLERALETVAEVAESERDAIAIRAILRDVRSGESFADALGLQPDRFSRLYINMVRAGEASGALAVVMERLAAFERTRDEMRSELSSALAYPALLLAVGTASLLVMLWYVAPSLTETLRSSGAEPTLALRLMLGAGEALRRWWPVLALLPTVAAGALAWWVGTASGRRRMDAALLRVPMIGRLVRHAVTARFARAMATLLGASVPILQALAIARSVLGNRAVEAALEPVTEAVKRGETVARSVAGAQVFSALVGRLLAVGEETGHLDRMFDQVATIYERQTREALKRFNALLEPLVILLLGGLIAVMVFGTLLALSGVQRMGL